MATAPLQTPDVDAVDDEASLGCVAVLATKVMDALVTLLMLQDRPGRSATCPSPGRWSHPLQLSTWETLLRETF